ncbi:MAG TPA: hexose kinase [Terrimesophilobacter sp.]|nr:hexose kinase [Terrimesophilobacter sp.]
MILTVTPNPAIDLTYTVPALVLGDSQRVDGARSRAGGKGVNVARVAHQLGHSVLVVAPVGGHGGLEFTRELEASGLPHFLVPVSADTRRSVALVETDSGRTSVLNERGHPLRDTDWATLTTSVRDRMGEATCLVGSGSLPPDADDGFYAGLVGIGRTAGVPVLIDTTGAALRAAARAGADVLKPNRSELADATGLSSPIDGASWLLDAGARLVLVSLGEDGMLAMSATERDPLFARLPAPLAGNPTGAGDAAVAAAAVCYSSGSTDRAVLLRMATAWSAAAVRSPVAGEVVGDLADLEATVLLRTSNGTR